MALNAEYRFAYCSDAACEAQAWTAIGEGSSFSRREVHSSDRELPGLVDGKESWL